MPSTERYIDTDGNLAERPVTTATLPGIITAWRDQAIAIEPQDEDSVDHEGEMREALAEDAITHYHEVARALGLLDEETSASVQHYIETGAYLLTGEAIETNHEAAPEFVCAECGTTEATTYVVTTLDSSDPEGTRTEVCRSCNDALAESGGDTTVEEADGYLRSVGINPESIRA